MFIKLKNKTTVCTIFCLIDRLHQTSSCLNKLLDYDIDFDCVSDITDIDSCFF